MLVPESPPASRARTIPLLYWGLLLTLAGIGIYFLGIVASIIRLALRPGADWRAWNEALLWYSGVPATIGIVLITADIALAFPERRRIGRRVSVAEAPVTAVTVALTAYNDEDSIGEAVRDFGAHPLVARVLVVSNNSSDATMARARAAGAVVHDELHRGYGWCVYRCLSEAVQYEDTGHVVLCEGDRTFRAADIGKLVAYMPHACIVNGTRIVEQLREARTQLGGFMFLGNFFGGKLLEAKHFGKGTFTDLGTTYKMADRRTLMDLLPRLDPRINLEFNAHFLDVALSHDLPIVECPITFHPRVGQSKGGNVSNLRAIRVGLRMMVGLSFGWRWLR